MAAQNPLSISGDIARQIMSIDELQKPLDWMPRDRAALSAKKRKEAIASHNRKTDVLPVDFGVG